MLFKVVPDIYNIVIAGSERGSPRSDEGEDRDIWDMTEEVSDDEGDFFYQMKIEYDIH